MDGTITLFPEAGIKSTSGPVGFNEKENFFLVNHPVILIGIEPFNRKSIKHP